MNSIDLLKYVFSFHNLNYRFKKPPSPLSEFRESSFGHGRLKVMDGKRAHWSWHRNNDSNSLLADEVWLDSLSTSSSCWPSSRSNDEL